MLILPVTLLETSTLSERRANAVIFYIVTKYKMPLNRLVQPFGYGELEPVGENTTKEDREALEHPGPFSLRALAREGHTPMRKTLIAEYHTALAGDEGLTREFFARLKTMMRTRRLLYGAREIGEWKLSGREIKLALVEPKHSAATVTSSYTLQ
jgi:hypothetical protein